MWESTTSVDVGKVQSLPLNLAPVMSCLASRYIDDALVKLIVMNWVREALRPPAHFMVWEGPPAYFMVWEDVCDKDLCRQKVDCVETWDVAAEQLKVQIFTFMMLQL